MSARVLIIDNDAVSVKLLTEKLKREYYEVITASGGVQGLDRILNDRPDIVLLSVSIPDIDAFEVCARIRANPIIMHIPLVLITGLNNHADWVRGLQTGADDFLTKPINDTALFARMRSLVRLKRMMDEWQLRTGTSGQLGGDFGVPLAKAALPTGGIAGARIMVVDDSAQNFERLAQPLAEDGAEIVHMPAVAPAVERLDAEPYDLVIISLSTRGEDGLRFVALLRSHETTRQVPLLLAGIKGDYKQLAKALELGANDYVLKPIDEAELRARVHTQIQRKRHQDTLRANYEQGLSLALTDSLTGVFNRRYLDAHLPRLLARAREIMRPIAVLMFDIDHFKHINDTHGHLVGDSVLVELSARVREHLRSADFLARLGGDEFVVVLPDVPLEQARIVADRLRAMICDKPFPLGKSAGSLSATTSIGLAVVNNGAESVDEILKRADDSLYQAKRGGRNRVSASEGPAIVPAMGMQPVDVNMDAAS